jgi:hypothetical protein
MPCLACAGLGLILNTKKKAREKKKLILAGERRLFLGKR